MSKQAPPFAFFFLHAATGWPIGVVGLALGSSLVRAGIAVHQVAGILAAVSLAFTFEFLWGPLVDSSLTRKSWNAFGAAVTFACLLAMFVVPWRQSTIPLLIALTFASCSGAAIALVAVKGIMAHDVPTERLGAASAFYSAGGTLGKAAAGAIAVLLLAHLSSRFSAGVVSIFPATIAAATILLAARGPASRLAEFPSKIRASLLDVWNFVRQRKGMLIAILCVIPFGSGTEAGFMGAISREWSVTPNQLALVSTFGAATNIAGVIVAGWLCTRVSPWSTYIAFGLAMVAMMVTFAVAPRNLVSFVSIELLYRACSNGCYVALLGIVMMSVGKGAVSSKAALMWSLTNFSVFYPTLIEGHVHDRVGTTAMLLTDASLGLTGFAVLMLARRVLGSIKTVDDGLALAEAGLS
jgi:predicted MFS family arabinose efflux permease